MKKTGMKHLAAALCALMACTALNGCSTAPKEPADQMCIRDRLWPGARGL